ncbi:NADP-dependent oxidoreductase [Streptomonospora litoralis]|uniref:Zinc-type alcohol dehydrogenase-like protein n=1 Tax=Streptomonospora litoralis TaxID=2498135 RepID=A0A4P6Q1X5_9ACTN|nr:NADP-dependent oxidoreductase [Streptomonospora litoralis]QBI52839.1 Zinc-type alcohol dehydrogenase-like protein [Streptomonospora litoralis]
MTASKTMRAVSQEVHGGPEVLHEVEAYVPEPGPSQVLVRVHAAGVNPTDWKHRADRMFLGDPPYVLGWDVSGVVEAVGIGVTVLEPGDEVMGMLPYPHGAGSFAEYATGPARAFARKPELLTHTEAGALPLAALTAWQALADTAGVEAGQRVLVHAAAGGVGHLAVQIAKARGAHVLGTASAGKHGFLREIGVDEPIDYRETDFAEAAQGVDVVLDTVGGEYAFRSLRTLREGGTLVTILPIPPEGLLQEATLLGVRAKPLLVEADHAGMAAIADLAASGRLRPHVSEVFPLSRIADAHRAGETGRTTGKLVVDVAAG